ncbi:unnamed protein product [Calicophoron daubneyi]|uniref:Uncharacterized protein n=1 Tax=Calicophoron daubneyi TaxID=300641 RepID=A0AAV2U266_CALDB
MRSNYCTMRARILLLRLLLTICFLSAEGRDVSDSPVRTQSNVNRIYTSGEIFHALLDDSRPQLSSDSDGAAEALIGNPQIIDESDGLSPAVRFSTSFTDGLMFSPSSRGSVQCPWNISACVSGHFTFGFDILPPSIPVTGRLHILTVSVNDSQFRPTLQYTLLPNNTLLTTWNSPDKGISECHGQKTKLQDGKWSTVETTVKVRTGEASTTVNGLLEIDGNVKSAEPLAPVSDMVLLSSPNSFLGIVLGNLNASKDLRVHEDGLSLRNVYMDTPDTVRRRTPRALADTLLGIPMNRIQDVVGLNLSRGGFVRYDFRNRIRKQVEKEELTLNFTMPIGVDNGLIWFTEDGVSKNYVYIKDRRLHYTYVVIDQTGRAQRTLTEEIFLDTELTPESSHTLTLTRDQDTLTLTLDDRSQASKSFVGRSPLVMSEGRVYLGGSDSPELDTDGKAHSTFRGLITKAELSQDGRKQVDLITATTDPQWRGSVSSSGDVQYQYRPPQAKLVISPTASKPFRVGWLETSSKTAMALTREPIPITFMGTQSSVVRFDTWDFTVYHSFEIEFTTFEPNGILFFVGPDREHTDFVCVELFDGNVYFVYAVGDHYRHIQLNPNGMKVNNGMTSRVYVSRNKQHRFLIKFNGQVVDVDQGTEAHQTEFATYTYIGSVDQPSRLPWHVWSRENFAGCISSIRINDDKFLDPSSRMSQHTDVSRGIQFGVCRVPDRRCSQDTCGGGQCAERSYPFFEPLNFACDCSGSDKTYVEGVNDLRRSETCFRDAPILEMDGEMVLLIDFERQMNTLTTHTDDISLQFRTKDLNTPLFYAVSPTDRSYFLASLYNGRLQVSTNIHQMDNRMNSKDFLLESTPPLNDNQWHTLRIRRRADYISFSVDTYPELTGKLKVDYYILRIIPLQGIHKTFKLVAQQIYLGSNGPANYERPPDPGSDVKFLPPPPRFTGEFRNFYWNEYDFIGTSSLPSKYTTNMLTPRAILPTFPQWPREPTYSITCKPGLIYGRLDRPIDVKEGGDMWLIEFKSEYDGVLMSAQDSERPDQVQISLVLLRGRLHVVYSIYGRSGVHQIISGPGANRLNDGQWHRLVVGLDRRRKQLMAFLDTYPPEPIGNALPVTGIKNLRFHFGGVAGAEWQQILSLLQTYAPGSLQNSEAEGGKQPAFTGCLGGFSLRSDQFSSDLLRRYESQLTSYPADEITRGFCLAQKRCSSTYCKNGGRCEYTPDRGVRCICTGTGYEGSQCEIEVTVCPPGYCHRGVCRMVKGNPQCDCKGTGYYGDKCEQSRCTGYCLNGGSCRVEPNGDPVCDCTGVGYTGTRCDQPVCTPGFCQNGGRCQLNSYGTPECICTGTGFTGSRCQTPICSPGYCAHGGRCMVDSSGQPRCDCSGTGHGGSRCEQSVCPVGFCANGGRCIVDSAGQPKCDCTATGFGGSRCEQQLCTPDYCTNGGRCQVDQYGRATCVCTGTGYTGPRCQTPICTPNFCANGGRCTVDANERPRCECGGTGYGGDRCERAICTPGYCLNGGRCQVDSYGRPECVCTGTDFRGPRCETPICQPGYCANRGRCVADPSGQPRCECSGTGFGGTRCEQPICTPGYCRNGGQCFLSPAGQPTCRCKGTGHTGSLCETPICSRGYCLNGGRCTVNANDQPECNCDGTGYRGGRCETPICPPNYCLHDGVCRVNQAGQPTCDCMATNYGGERCEIAICPKSFCGDHGICVVRQRKPTCDCYPGYRGTVCEIAVCPDNYCINGGVCSPGPDRQPHCTCPANYEGERCELPKICPPDYCFHGGRCSMTRGVPQCDCLGTDYTGVRCEIPQVCPAGFCQNGGVCSVKGGNYVCDCTGTGYRGVICTEPVACPKDYCLFGGTCSVLPGNKYVCDCSRTGRTGQHCESSSNGMYIGYDKDGYLIYNLIPSVRTTEDNVTLGFKTYMQTGTILTFLTPDGRHWAIKLRDGRVMVDASGMNVYGFQMRSNDGHYHVLNIERKKDTMIVMQDDEVIRVHLPTLVAPDGSITYNAIHVAADENKSDIFRGVIGGLHWNGRYPLNELKEGRIRWTGEVTIVLTPEFPILPPKPQPVCLPGYCLNGGRCYAENYELKCDCRQTGWNGVRCERQSRGYIPYEQNNGAYVVYYIRPQQRTNSDEMRVAFQTWAPNGPIARVVHADDQYYDIKLVNKRPEVTFNGRQIIPIGLQSRDCADGLMHVITVNRDKSRFNFTVDGHTTQYVPTGFTSPEGSLIPREIVLGADKDFKKTFNGVIGGFYWNGKYLIDERGRIVSDAKVMIAPGHTPSKNMEEVVVVLMPHLLPPIRPVKPSPPKPLPEALPEGYIGGGLVMPGLGTGNANLGAPIYILQGKVYGGGGAGMNAGTGLMLKQAGGLLGMGPLVDALLAGLLLGLLLLISALIWACWRCKPGCCGFCMGKGHGAGGPSAWDRFIAKCCAAPGGTALTKEKKSLLNNAENGLVGIHDTMDIGGTTYNRPGRSVYAQGQSSRLDLGEQIDTNGMSAIQIAQPVIGDQNIYNVEGLKVDSVMITKNSKYFVTGSSMGPPKVWDSQSGEVYKIMDGLELGCTDLHLACDDTVLVTQVVDETAGVDTLTDMNAIKVKRLQLWDFASGRQLEMPVDVMCTATCLTRSSAHVIVARSTPGGPSILVWDLAGNQQEHEIFYQPLSPLVKDSVTYLNISHDDRLVLAGFQNPQDDQACYMIFDLAANYGGQAQPQIVTFDAEVNATEVIGNDLAVTGTRKGELLVWNLHTGTVVRQIQINATLEGGNTTVLPPHTGIVHCVQLSTDHQFLVTGAQDQLVRVWTMPDERLLHTLEGHADDVLSVAISVDSEIVVSGSWDGSIRVWRIRDGNQICWFTSNIEILQVKISNDKRSLVALGERNGHRKLITLRVVRNRVRTTTTLRTGASRVGGPMSPPTPGMSPGSPGGIIA